MRKAPHMFCRVFPELWKSIEQGNYLLFKYYYSQPPQPNNPNIISSIYDEPVINSNKAPQNLRIVAELLRSGAELEYIVIDGYPAAFLPHRAVRDRLWPLICLLLYVRGMEPFTTISNCEGKTAMEKWVSQGLREVKPHTEGLKFFEIVQTQKALIAEGDILCRQQQPFEAFKKYNAAALMVLEFHQGDQNLIPFYQEEAIAPFSKAVQALIQDISQASAPTSHLLDVANIQNAKRTHLIFYITGTVLSTLGPARGLDPRKDQDKMVDPARFRWFTDALATWQVPQVAINWADPTLAPYNPHRLRSDSNDSRDSAVGKSAENLVQNSSV